MHAIFIRTVKGKRKYFDNEKRQMGCIGVVLVASYHPFSHFPIGVGKLLECCLSFGIPLIPRCFVFFSLNGLSLSLATVSLAAKKASFMIYA